MFPKFVSIANIFQQTSFCLPKKYDNYFFCDRRLAEFNILKMVHNNGTVISVKKYSTVRSYYCDLLVKIIKSLRGTYYIIMYLFILKR